MLVEKSLVANKGASTHAIQHLILSQELESKPVFLKISDFRED